jgi:cytochrome c-type biogenesis protein CcsB
MSPLEAILVWITIGLYGVTSALFLYAFIFRNEKVLDRIKYIIFFSVAVHTAAILARWYAVGNLPVAGNYENALGGVWVILLFYLYVSFRYKHLRAIGLAVLPFSLLLLGYGIMNVPPLAPMTASLRSFWLYIHVFFAWLAFGAYTICFGLGILFLMKEKNQGNSFYDKFPALPRMDELMFRYLIFGFITDAVMIASGAIWAKNLWGNYWSWDPVETWSLVAWLIYGLAIHLRVTMGWKGRKLAWILIFAIAGVIISYFGINVVVKSSLHIFEVRQGL